MKNRWEAIEKESKLPKVEPWMSFGVALVLAVSAVLFAVGTWVVRSGQTSRALERSAKTAEELAQRNESLKKSELAVSQLQEEAIDLRKQIGEQLALFESQRSELTKVQAELEGSKRDLEGTRASLANARKFDVDPSSLPESKIAEIAWGKPLRVFVFLDDQNQRTSVSKGSLMEFIKQSGQLNCGLSFDDTSKNWLVLSVIVTSAADDRSAVSVSLELRQPWKPPGVSGVRWVSVWQSHAVGMSTAPNVASLVEGLIDDMLKQQLAKELGK